MDIYVGNLAYATDDESLRAAFAAYGEVTSARVVTDRMTNRSKGFGFVEMPNEDEANAAIAALNGAVTLLIGLCFGLFAYTCLIGFITFISGRDRKEEWNFICQDASGYSSSARRNPALCLVLRYSLPGFPRNTESLIITKSIKGSLNMVKRDRISMQ